MKGNSPLRYFYDDQDPKERTFRTVTMVMFIVAVGTLLARLFVAYALPSDMPELAVDAIFTVIVQIGFFVALPFLVYKFVLKKSAKQIAEFSSMKKTKWYNVPLSVSVGICAYIATIGVSMVWLVILIILGYDPSTSPTVYPDRFNAGMFIAEILLTAVLPGFCEEFLIRGGVLSAMKSRFNYVVVLVVMGVIFGLFHQNITQVFYTACFGVLMAFLTIKLKSIYPAMIIHTVNNGLSVYLSYAEQYNWFGGNFTDLIQTSLQRNPLLVLVCYALIVGIGVGLVALMLFLKSRENIKKQKEVVLDSGFDVTNGRVVMMGEEKDIKPMVEEIGMEKTVYGKNYAPEPLYKPKLRDNAFLLGALVVTVMSTLTSFIGGLF